MATTSQTRRTSVIGTNAVGQAIPFTFPITSTSDLIVRTRVIATGVEALLDETTNYTVDILDDDEGGSVTMVTAVATTSQIHVIRKTPKTQSLDLETGGNFNAENIESALDKNTKLIVENADSILNKALTLPETDASALTSILPSAIDRASKVLSFDSSGNATATAAVPAGSVSFSTNGTSLVEAANFATMMNLLLPKVDCRQYAVSGTGTLADPWVDALREAYAAKGVNYHYYLPAGHYKDATTIDIDGSGRISISGDGIEVTKIHYATADQTSAIKFHNSGSACVEIFMSDLSFDGDGTCTGAAVEIEDLSIGSFERITIEDFDGLVLGHKVGRGFWLKGREKISFQDIRITNTTIGFFIDDNPNSAIDLDHSSFKNISIGCNEKDDGYGIRLTCDGLLHNLTFEQIGVNNCKYGFYYKAGTAAAAPTLWSFRDIRVEQGDTTNKDCWAFHLEGTATYWLKTFLFENIYFGDTHNGIKLIYGWNSTFINCRWPAAAGYTWADIDDVTIDCAIISSYYNTAGTDARPIDNNLIYKQENATNGRIGFVLYDASRGNWTTHLASKVANIIQTIANNATPTIKSGNLLITGGTTTITDFDDGVTGQAITVIAAHTVTITNGTNIFLRDNRNWTMRSGDTLSLVQKADTFWYETARSNNASNMITSPIVCANNTVMCVNNEVVTV